VVHCIDIPGGIRGYSIKLAHFRGNRGSSGTAEPLNMISGKSRNDLRTDMQPRKEEEGKTKDG
jgi:hypothetical protein